MSQVDNHLNLELFGTARGATGLNSLHLANLAANLPHNNYYTADHLIDNHTLLPFYSPFIPERRVTLFRRGMKQSNGCGFTSHSGISASSIPSIEYLRYCPLCAQEDKKKFGQYYWHRLHQVFGIVICPKHKLPIQNSTVSIASMTKYGGYVSAERALPLSKGTSSFPLITKHNILLRLASDAAWLLNQRGLIPGFELIYARYIGLLIDYGLTDHTGRPKYQITSTLLSEFYGRDLLTLLRCEIDAEKPSAWSLRIVTDLLREKAHHPLRYLLLINFLGNTAESFFSQCSKATQKRVHTFLNPFGKGPWPCLNPTCKSFRRNVIDKCHSSNQKYAAIRSNMKRCMVASFNCTCGFTYCRREVDLLVRGKFQYSFIRSYGPIWEGCLSKLWSDSSISLEKMAKALGVSPRGLKNQALRIGLTFPRQGPKSGIINCDRKCLLKLKEKTSKFRSVKAQYRQEWLAILKIHPKVTQRFLRKSKGYKFFIWLRKHDQTWLNNHMPQPSNRLKVGRNFDWGARDVQLSKEAEMAMFQVKRSEDRPMRITKNLIMRFIKRENLIGSLSKLPLTAKKISEAVETREEYAIRRLYWAIARLRKEQNAPSRSALRKLGGMDDFWHTPSMKSFFDEILEELQNTYLTTEVA